MIIVDKSYRITSSNVAFNSYVGKDANGMNLSLCLRSNELNDALSDALTNEKKSDINFIIYDQVHKYIQAQIFPLKIKKEIFALVMMIDETPQKIAEKLKDIEIDSFPTSFKNTTFIEDIKTKHQSLEDGDQTDISVLVRGRILSIRSFGKLTFIDIKDMTGKIQLLVAKDDLHENLQQYIELLDVGDLIGTQGNVMKTKKGDLISVAGGGDTVSALNKAGVTDSFTYISTAGGAFLESLEGKELPGIKVLKK